MKTNNESLNLAAVIEHTLNYLASAQAMESIDRDPYWPKWNSPWWHMRLLHELGLVKKIPAPAIIKMVEKLKCHYLPVFPIREDEFPEGTDPIRKIACLCVVGSMYQVLFDYGIAVDEELPWMRKWFLRYQLPDGGLNCDEQVYLKPVPKSSIVTTLNCLEAVLFCRNRNLTEQEIQFLNNGANYLLRQKLFRKVSTGEIINSDWLEIRFPRFYNYDFLRGFYFLAKWRQESGFFIPKALEVEVAELVARQLTKDGIKLKRYNLIDKRSYNPDSNGKWSWGLASEFDLFKAVSFDGAICDQLAIQWNEVKPKVANVMSDL